jgi:DNA repair exonuclease SbcCD ATPase subunit
MLKKLGIAALVAVVAVFAMSRLGLTKYAKVYWHEARDKCIGSIPAETKIKALREEITKLEPEARKHRAAIASEMVEIEHLQKQIAEARTNLDKKEAMIKDLRKEVQAGNTFVSLGGERIPKKKVEESLTRQWNAFRQAEDAVKSQEELLRHRQESLEVANQKLAAMENKRVELQSKVEMLDLELRKLRLAQTKHDIPIDDSHLSQVLKLYGEVETQIAKEQKAIELEKGLFTDTVVEKAMEQKAKTEKALKEMDERFHAEAKMTFEGKK